MSLKNGVDVTKVVIVVSLYPVSDAQTSVPCPLLYSSRSGMALVRARVFGPALGGWGRET